MDISGEHYETLAGLVADYNRAFLARKAAESQLQEVRGQILEVLKELGVRDVEVNGFRVLADVRTTRRLDMRKAEHILSPDVFASLVAETSYVVLTVEPVRR